MTEKEQTQQQMKDFINALLEEYYPHTGDIDGFTFQDMAEKHGIIVRKKRFAPCGDECACAEFFAHEDWKDGIDCFEPAPWLVE